MPSTAVRQMLAALAFAHALLVLTNLAQHHWHPPLSLVEAQAAIDLGGPDCECMRIPTRHGFSLLADIRRAKCRSQGGHASTHTP